MHVSCQYIECRFEHGPVSLAQCECNAWKGEGTVEGEICVDILSLCCLIHAEVNLHQLVWYYLLKNGNVILH